MYLILAYLTGVLLVLGVCGKLFETILRIPCIRRIVDRFFDNLPMNRK